MVESLSFGSESLVVIIYMELLVSLSYKLRMFGGLIEDPAYVFCGNQSVMKNVTLHQSVLNKRQNLIFYHKVHEAQTTEIIRVVWIQCDHKQDYLGTNCWGSTGQRFQVELTKTVTDGSPRTEKDTKYVTHNETACST